MQNNWPLCNAHLEVLFANDLKTFFSLDAFEDHRLVDASGNRGIAVVAIVRLQSMGICFLPELLVIKGFEPFLNFVAVFKFEHVPMIANFGFMTQENSSKGCTACL